MNASFKLKNTIDINIYTVYSEGKSKQKLYNNFRTLGKHEAKETQKRILHWSWFSAPATGSDTSQDFILCLIFIADNKGPKK